MYTTESDGDKLHMPVRRVGICHYENILQGPDPKLLNLDNILLILSLK